MIKSAVKALIILLGLLSVDYTARENVVIFFAVTTLKENLAVSDVV